MRATLIRSKKLFFLVDDINHKEIYWSSRYQNIHRLITHCSHRPERFHAYGMLMISTKEKVYESKRYENKAILEKAEEKGMTNKD